MVWRPLRRRQRVGYGDGNDNGNDDSNGNRISGANASFLARSSAKQPTPMSVSKAAATVPDGLFAFRPKSRSHCVN
jgi:hypothetical protein